MALGHRRSWKITVHAKISNLYIKLKATVKRPSGKLQGLLKLDKLLIGVDSKSKSRILIEQPSTFRTRMLSFVKKHFGRRRSKSKTSVGFKMSDASYIVLETEYQSWHLGRLELSCVVVFGVGLGYLLAEFGPSLKRKVGINFDTIPSLSSIVLVFLVLFVLWLHRFKFLCAMLISVLSFLLLERDRFLQHFNFGHG